jgi:integrase
MSSKLVKAQVDAQLSVLVPAAELAVGYARAAKADRTREEYAKQWKKFQHFCDAQELPALPATPQAVAMYLSVRADAGKKVSTLAQALAAIRHKHDELGLDAPNDHRIVKLTMAGIRKTHGVRPDRKAPVLAEMLARMSEVLPDTLMGARDRALLLVCFCGAFRRAEVVSLEVSDLAFGSEGITVTLRKSKTDQEQLGRDIGLPYESTSRTCPVRSMRTWLDQAGVTEGPAFRSVDRHGNLGESLGAQEVARIVKRTAVAAGLDPKHLSGHSLRAGLTTSAAKAGKSMATIMKQTGHGSIAMVMRYVRAADLFTDNAAAGLL